ncbi:MAG: hypothetical protein ACRECD_01200 [Burkholderiaceae bacterium]
MTDLFSGFDPAEVLAAGRQFQADRQQTERARAQKSANRHHMRRATAEAYLADILPARFADGESWHVISRGDIDSLSYLRHVLAGVSHLDQVLMSTWCIAKNDLQEIATWLDAGKIEQFDLYAGEIFPGSYGDEYEQMMKMCETYGCRLVIAKNHSKITLASQAETAYHLTIESSANVNTNPRIEQSTIHCGAELHAFYLEFFSGIKSIDRHSKTH